MGGRKAGEGGCRIVYKLGGGNQRQLQNHVTAEAFFLLHGYYTNTMLALSLQYTLNRNFKNGAKILELIFSLCYTYTDSFRYMFLEYPYFQVCLDKYFVLRLSVRAVF